jgi:hypothetical protein
VLVALRVPDVDVHDVIQTHRRHVVEAMQRYTRLKGDTPEKEVPLAVVVDAQLFRLEAIVRWLDAADTRLAGRPAAAPSVPVARNATPLARKLGVRT